MSIEFKDITESDLEFVREVFNYYIRNSLKNYRIREMSLQDARDAVSPGHPVYVSRVILEKGEPCGFIYLSRFRKREAYDRTAEITIYLKPGHTGKGLGRSAMEHMEPLAKRKGIHILVGIIGGDNRGSIDFFSHMGYTRCGHFREVAEKSGRILDMVAYQKSL